MLEEYLEELTKEASALDERKVLGDGLSKMSVGDLAKLAGVSLPHDVCPHCAGLMEKQGSILKCSCGMMKSAAEDKDLSWWDSQKGMYRAMRASDKGVVGKLIADPELIDKRLKGGASGAGIGAIGGAGLGALIGALGKGKPGMGALIGGAIGVPVGGFAGISKGEKDYLKSKGITRSLGGLGMSKFTPEARKRYIDKYKKASAEEEYKEASLEAIDRAGRTMAKIAARPTPEEIQEALEEAQERVDPELMKQRYGIGGAVGGGLLGAGAGAGVGKLLGRGPLGMAVGGGIGALAGGAGGGYLGQRLGGSEAREEQLISGLQQSRGFQQGTQVGYQRGAQAGLRRGALIGASMYHRAMQGNPPQGAVLKASPQMRKQGTAPDFGKTAGTPFLEQDRSEKVKEIYKALKRDHPDMPAEMKARIAARQGKRGKQHQGPPYKGPLTKGAAAPAKTVGETLKAIFSHPAVFTGGLGAVGGAGVGALAAPDKKELKGALIGGLAGGTIGGVGGLLAKTFGGSPRAWKEGFGKGQTAGFGAGHAAGWAEGEDLARRVGKAALEKAKGTQAAAPGVVSEWKEVIQQALGKLNQQALKEVKDATRFAKPG